MGRVVHRALGLVLAASMAFEASAQGLDYSGKEEFAKASTYFEAEEYEAALPLFQMAYNLSARKPATVLALAQCERAMKRYSEAIKHFREYLALKPTPKNAAEVEETVALVERLALMEGPKAPPDKVPAPSPTASLPPIPEPNGSPQPDLVASSSVATSLIAAAPAKEEEKSILSSPWLWIATGVAVIGGGVAIAVAASSGGENLYGGNSGLVFRP